MVLTGVADDITAITTVATQVLSWFITTATSIFNFIIGNPLALMFLSISLIFVAYKILKRFVKGF